MSQPSSQPPAPSRQETAPQLLSRLYPPLRRYWPNLTTVSAPQAAFLLLDQLEAFYGGAAGGGKSDALLAAALQYVDVPGYAALILRRTFRQLDQPDAIMARSKEWLANTDAAWNDDAKRWTFPSTATLTFGYLEHDNDVYNYQGPAYQFVGWDELTQFAEKQYTYLFSRTRRRKDLAALNVPIRHRSASNPGGVGHAWVKQRFIDRSSGSLAVFIPAKVDDNPGLDVAEYKLSLAALDETLRAQLLHGDWGVFEGAAFRLHPEHLIGSFEPEDAFDRFEALDYGLNGAPWASWLVDYDGNLIVNDMLYGRDLLPSELAPMVLGKRLVWGEPSGAYCDPSVWRRTGGRNRFGEPAMLADEFGDNGTPLIRANNDPRAGLIRLRELLDIDPAHSFPEWHPRAGEQGAPRMFIRRHLVELLDELQAAPLQPLDRRDGGEIIDPVWESQHGHGVAMCRYAAMSRPSPSDRPKKIPDDPRAALLQRVEERWERDMESRGRYTIV